MFDVEQIGGWVLEEEARRSQQPWRSPAYDTDDTASRAMVKRRRDFELMLGDNPDEVTDEQRLRAWELADSEPWPDHMTSDEMHECYGLARHL